MNELEDCHRIAFHSENGPTIGGSDMKLGVIADSLSRPPWEVFLLAGAEYPLEVVFRREPRPAWISDSLAANCAAPAAAPSAASPPEAPRGRSWRAGVRSLIPPRVLRWLGYRRTVRRVKQLLASRAIDVFQTMDGGPQPTVVGAKLAGCSVISHYAAPPDLDAGADAWRYSRLAWQYADVRIAASRHNAQAWAAYLGVDSSAFRVIHNGVELPSYTADERAAVRNELHIGPGDVVVGMTGRLSAEKGPCYLAQAACRLGARCPSAVFVFVGSGPEEESLRQLFEQAGLASRARFLGFRRDAARLTAAYDIAVVPSVFAEPFGMVVIEAMAAGVPVIASRTGGIPEIIEPGVSGILVPPADDAALAASIWQLLENAEARRAMGRAGRRRASRDFSRQRMLSEYQDVYCALAESRKGRSAQFA